MTATAQLTTATRAHERAAVLGRALRRAWPWLRLLIATGILAVLVVRLGSGAFVAGLRVINAWSIGIALGIGVLTTVPSAWRWHLVARNLGLPLTLGRAVSDYYQAFLLNAVLPAGVLGDVHRALRHGQRAGDVGRGVRAVVLERFAGQVVLSVIAVAVLLTHPALGSAVLPSRGVVLAVGCVLVAVVVVVVWVRRGSPAWRRALTTTLADARLGLLPRSTWPGAVLLSAVTVAGHVAMFVVAARVAGLSAPAVQLAPLMVLALVVMGLPVNIGGWGPREGFLAVAFGVAGLGAAQGVTASVVYGVLTLVSSLPGAVVLFLRRDRFYGSRIARYSPKHSTRPARRSFPF